MNITKYFIFVIFCFSSFSINAQNTSFRIDSIHISGNSKTKSSYILNNLDIELGKSYTSGILDKKLDNLSRINGLYDTKYTIDNNTLILEVAEQRSLLPVIGFGLVDKYYWFQIGILDINLGGRGIELYSYYRNNQGRHAGQLFIRRNPTVVKKWGFSIDLLSWSSPEPILFQDNRLRYEFHIDAINTGLLYSLNNQSLLTLEQGFFVEKYSLLDKEIAHGSLPEDLILDKYLTKLNYKFDNRKIENFTESGWKTTLQYQNVYTFEFDELFHIFEIESAYFYALSEKWNIASRMNVGTSTFTMSPFSPFLIDSYKNIRGSGDRIVRGSSLVTANLEFRNVVLNAAKWQNQLVLFSDIGMIQEPDRKLENLFKNNPIYAYYGIGTRIIYKKIFNAMLRIDFAISYENIKDNNLVIGIGQYF